MGSSGLSGVDPILRFFAPLESRRPGPGIDEGTCGPLGPLVHQQIANGGSLGGEVAAALAEREVALELPTLICRGFSYRLTDRQRLALARVILRHKVPEADVLRAAYPEVGNPDTACLMVPLPSGLTIGIERDGYTHS